MPNSPQVSIRDVDGATIAAMEAKAFVLRELQDGNCVYCGDAITVGNSWLWTREPELLKEAAASGDMVDLIALEVVCLVCKDEYSDSEG